MVTRIFPPTYGAETFVVDLPGRFYARDHRDNPVPRVYVRLIADTGVSEYLYPYGEYPDCALLGLGSLDIGTAARALASALHAGNIPDAPDTDRILFNLHYGA